ncbi:HesA/MoeB/ThiF family protein [Natronospora cellulosivora (SeqCode)]
MGGGSFDFSEEEIERYSRHIILKDIGGTGQQKIKEASVLVVGAGGLGSPVSLYLAAAGVGKLGLIDSDVVDLSNLQRQVIHTTADLDKPKVESAAETLRSINPHVDVKTYNTYLNKENIMDIIDEYDIIVDGVDNFPTRYLLNDACVMKGKTLVEAGILRFEGQVMTIKPGEGPCYRCVFTNPPAEGTIPSCQQAGVLGAIAGTIGTIQATEVIKLITGIGTPLIGKILIYDALDMSFRKVDLKKNADCPVCGDNPSITELMEYEISCQLHG